MVGAWVVGAWDSRRKVNPKAIVVDGASPFFSADSEKVRGKRVLAIEDGPSFNVWYLSGCESNNVVLLLIPEVRIEVVEITSCCSHD